MSYYEIFGLQKEPFSTSPDPSFLYLSRQHKAALCRLQIAIRLKRGLCVVMGDVGTGKTTLSRRLAQILRSSDDCLYFMILNPFFASSKQFLAHLTKIMHIQIPNKRATGMDFMEAIECFLFKKGVEEMKTIVLLIDEAQILPDFVLEMLRILLNYETNEFKILQLVLVGQLELQPRLDRMRNLKDRIGMKYVLNPMEPDELAKTIQFRLTQAGFNGIDSIFTDEAVELIYRHTQGYPRKFTLLCHNALASLVMNDRQVVDGEVIRKLIGEEAASGSPALRAP